jgi:hypothetical protein
MAEKSGPEKYAPSGRRPLEKLSNTDQATANAVEGETREFVRRDVSFLDPRRNEVATANDPAVENLNGVVRRVAGNSMEEIDRVIRALEGVRDMMRKEGERVSREIAGYASLSHAATTAMKVIADSIKQWKDAADKPGPR